MSQNLFEAERTSPLRARLVAAGLCFAFCAVGLQGAIVALAGSDSATTRVASSSRDAVSTRRAEIVDRNGERLATSVSVYSLYADPSAIWNAHDVAAGLVSILPDLDYDTILARLSDEDRRFVWLKRGLTPNQRQAVFDLGFEALGFREETRRFYPQRSLASHILGFTDVDGNGISGIEYALNDRLTSTDEPLQLTIDVGIQYSLEVELSTAAVRTNAEGGAGVVLDARTGEVLAMASWPMYDANRPQDADDIARFNRASSGVYELGSVFKPFTIAAGIDLGEVTLRETFDVRNPIRIGSDAIHDDHPLHNARSADLTTILAQSSNIGTVQVAGRIGPERQVRFLESLGLFEASPVELGSAAPLLPDYWSEVTYATASFGHGIAVSPMSFASAFATFANDGEYLAPTILMEGDPLSEPREPRRVMSAPTAQVVVEMMRTAVTEGTGRNADVVGYRVAGKTGTAEKPAAGGYDDDRNVTSFSAVFPADDPNYVVLIVLDEPTNEAGQAISAAFASAPAVGNVIERIAPILDVMPNFEDIRPSGPPVRMIADRRSL